MLEGYENLTADAKDEYTFTGLIPTKTYGAYVTGLLGTERSAQSEVAVITLPDWSAVDCILESEDAVEEWYDLQGRRLSHIPDSGIYIIRKGSKIMKRIADIGEPFRK